ncbi:MAG TPA: class I SAM-dependent methyltransferase [Xanthobacteraceae bacterium]|nr:class I SAM-dependent methyltransferase [Xanthobacteraceae bacterium]
MTGPNAMWRHPTILVRLWIDNVNIFCRSVGTRLVRKTAESVLRNLDLMGQMQDLFSSVEFERQNLGAVPTFRTRQELFRFSLDRVSVPDGLYAEFGVYKGDSINRLARLRPQQPFYGFDSFEGLPEAWTLGARTGAFSTGGRLPAVRDNVVLVRGVFAETLAKFVAGCGKSAAAFIHVDCDLYSATKTVLDHLAPLLVEGTIIVFDEYFNYPGWQQGEFKAFAEFIGGHRSLGYDYIGYIRNGGQVAVRLRSRSADSGGS